MAENTSEIDTLRAEMKAGFERAFAQTQGGFDEFHRFAMFLDERVRRDMNHGFSRMERRFEAVDEKFDRQDKRFENIESRLDRHDQRFDGIEARLDRHDQRFDGIEARLDKMDQRFDEVIRLIKER